MKITLLKYNNESLKVVFETGEYLFLPVDMEYVSNLSADKEISDEYFEKLKYVSDKFMCRRRLFKYLSGSDKSVFECRRYLKKKEFESRIIDEVIIDFTAQGYLNDVIFAEKYVSYLLRTKIVGKMYIIDKLRRKGINKDNISSALNKVFPEETDIVPVKEIACKKYKSIEKKKNKYAKIVNFLQSRGFTNDIVFSVLNEMKNEGYNFEDRQ